MLNELCFDIHRDNVVAGWWTDLKTGESLVGKRNVPEMLCLMHSEVSEGWLGCKRNCMDDKLPHRLMLEVELADCLIRMFDLLGSENVDFQFIVSVINQEFELESSLDYPSDILCDLHQYIDNAMEGYRKSKVREDGIHVFDAELAKLYITIMTISEYLGFDIMATIEEKRFFNKNRADHKMENRLKNDGKKF